MSWAKLPHQRIKAVVSYARHDFISAILLVCVGVVFVFSGIAFVRSFTAAHDQQVTLCAVHAWAEKNYNNKQDKVTATADLLLEHPEDPIFGIPRDLVIRGLERDRVDRDDARAFADSLDGLHCDESQG